MSLADLLSPFRLNRTGLAFILAQLLSAMTVLASGGGKAAHVDTAPAVPLTDPAKEAAIFRGRASQEIQGLLTVAHRAVERKVYADAEAAYHKLLALAVPDTEKRDALLEMGRMFEGNRAFAKAALVYEGFLERFREDPAAPDVSIRLGRACRELGAFKTALAKFYNALHSSLLRASGEDSGPAKKLALQAQFEIAETHYAKGDYAEARRFFTRLGTLKMSDDDRTLVEFRLTHTTWLAGDLGEAVALSQKFITEHPESERTPEVSYYLAQALQKLGRTEDAMRETLALLKSEKTREATAPAVWRTWKMRTGTELASALYERGDALNAATLYQRLAELDDKPEWRWPIVYQVGLCFERLRLTQRALEAYAFLVAAELPKPARKGSPAIDLASLKEMAQWKMDYLRWATDVDHKLSKVLRPDWQTAAIQPLKFRETSPTAPAPAASAEPASAEAH